MTCGIIENILFIEDFVTRQQKLGLETVPIRTVNDTSRIFYPKNVLVAKYTHNSGRIFCFVSLSFVWMAIVDSYVQQSVSIIIE